MKGVTHRACIKDISEAAHLEINQIRVQLNKENTNHLMCLLLPPALKECLIFV
jgi:hypothetical protein